MFGRVGDFAYRFRRFIPPGAVGLLLLLLLLSGPFGGQLSSGGYNVPGSQSQQAANLLSRYFGSNATQLLLVYQSQKPDAASPKVQAEVVASFRRLRSQPMVGSVLDYSDTKEKILIGDHGRATFAVINLKMSEGAATTHLTHLESFISRPPGLDLYVTGAAAIDNLYNTALEKQLKKAELFALPISLLLLVLLFGSVVAALLPLVIAGLAVPSSLGLISLLAAHIGMSIFVTNVATIIGLGLSIDYSLFFVKRFREELSRSDTQTAVRIASASAGKAVAISGTAVAVGLASLTLFPVAALNSMGLGGVIVVIFTLLFALTALPALLALLGPRVNRFSLRPSLRRPGPGAPNHRGFWGWLARAVMRHPVAIALPVLVLLLLAGTPFLSLRLSTGSDVANIPPGPARTGYALLNDQFPQSGGIDEINLVVHYPSVLGGRLTLGQEQQLSSYLARVRRLPGVQGVTGVFSPPAGTTEAAYLSELRLAPSARSSKLNSYISGFLAGSLVQFEVGNSFGPDSTPGARLVGRLRSLSPPSSSQVLVSGGAAQSVDFLHAFGSAVPWAILMVVGVTMLVLFLTFGSVFLPIKAVLMSLVSISAAFGAMVWIFQQGHLANFLQFTPAGSITATLPVLMFAILFGLSMDYEVFLLSRIRESYLRTGDNRRAVEEGMVLTGGVITSAALIMIVVFASFAAGHVLEIQTLGVGMAVAVAVDATLVRGILVPALMRILGRANWWAPAPLQRLVARAGFYESETRATGPSEPPRTEPASADA